MRTCSVLGCRMKTDDKQSRITLHKLPACKEKQKQWIDILGVENLKKSFKYMYICSLHFEEKSFYKYLNSTRLRDDALPCRELLFPAQLTQHSPVSPDHQQSVPHNLLEDNTVSCPSQDKATKIIQKLKSQCEDQKKKIKRLHEKVRRQGKKIAYFKIIMKELKVRSIANDDIAAVSEQYAGSKD